MTWTAAVNVLVFVGQIGSKLVENKFHVHVCQYRVLCCCTSKHTITDQKLCNVFLCLNSALILKYNYTVQFCLTLPSIKESFTNV